LSRRDGYVLWGEISSLHGARAAGRHREPAYAALPTRQSVALQAFLNSLILFPPDDTASTLDPAVPAKPNFPQYGHGSIKLTVLFNDPTDPE
jgi:hypothetical protein